MTSPVLRSFAAQIGELERSIRDEWRWPSPEAAFTVWLARRAGIETPTAPGPLDQDRWDEAPYLATAGFLAGATRLDVSIAERWSAGMAKLAQKDPLPADRNSFVFRPLELLGITVGTSHLSLDRELVRWLRDAVARGEQLFATDAWSRALTGWAARNLAVELSASTDDGNVETMALALLERRPNANGAAFVEKAATTGAAGTDVARSSTLWVALQTTVGALARGIETAHSADAVEVVQQICHRFPTFVKQLGLRHNDRQTLEIDDEYDVQDALHAVLRLHFSDVRDEEPSPSHAGAGTRLDLLLKSERIVIETKMTRPNLTDKKLGEEIAVDKERYRSHPDCGTIIFFVYDPERRLKNPTALERDASEALGTVRCIVIVAPRDSGADTSR